MPMSASVRKRRGNSTTNSGKRGSRQGLMKKRPDSIANGALSSRAHVRAAERNSGATRAMKISLVICSISERERAVIEPPHPPEGGTSSMI